jgi:hypothetical protein
MRDFVRSELKSLIFKRRAHLSLYLPACRVFFAHSVPERCPL